LGLWFWNNLREENELRNWDVRSLAFASKESIEMVASLG